MYEIIQGLRWAEGSDVCISNPWTQETRQDCDLQANWVTHQRTREIQENKITHLKHYPLPSQLGFRDSIKPKEHTVLANLRGSQTKWINPYKMEGGKTEICRDRRVCQNGKEVGDKSGWCTLHMWEDHENKTVSMKYLAWCLQYKRAH